MQVNLSPVASGLSVDETMDLYCAKGEQILQWVSGTGVCNCMQHSNE